MGPRNCCCRRRPAGEEPYAAKPPAPAPPVQPRLPKMQQWSRLLEPRWSAAAAAAAVRAPRVPLMQAPHAAQKPGGERRRRRPWQPGAGRVGWHWPALQCASHLGPPPGPRGPAGWNSPSWRLTWPPRAGTRSRGPGEGVAADRPHPSRAHGWMLGGPAPVCRRGPGEGPMGREPHGTSASAP